MHIRPTIHTDKQKNDDDGAAASDKGLCASVGCDKPAAMACPKCLELKRSPTLFCSQARF